MAGAVNDGKGEKEHVTQRRALDVAVLPTLEPDMEARSVPGPQRRPHKSKKGSAVVRPAAATAKQRTSASEGTGRC